MYMRNTYAQGIDYEIMIQALTTGIFQKLGMSVLGRRLALVSRDLLGMSSVCACRGQISLILASHSDSKVFR